MKATATATAKTVGGQMTPEQIENEMAQFHGTEGYHISSMVEKMAHMVHTDGIKALVDMCNANWLLDLIASHQPKLMKRHPDLCNMQFWTLRRDAEGNGAVAICERDEGDEVMRQDIQYTDFPLREVKIWVEAGWAGQSVMVMMLPNER